MKKSFLSALLLMIVTLSAMAIPAKRGVVRTLTLANGATVEATLVGDEFGHYFLGTDGKAYRLNPSTNVYEEANTQAITQRAQARRAQANTQRAKRLSPKRVGSFGNYTGKKKGVIILVNFADKEFKVANDNALFQRIANEKNFSHGDFVGSMYDYFYAQSRGQFELTFDVVGPVSVSKNAAYYGSNNSNDEDEHPAEMIIEAVKKADSQVNFADYDWDGDKYVDQVYVVYAGKGEADGGAANTIWPHAYDLRSAQYYGDGTGPVKLDGVTINTYACGGELNGFTGSVAGIGTMCHEFSHCLGYPDFYDIDYSGGWGMDIWDLMSGGSYNGDGYVPCSYTAYERWMAGWMEPIELSNTQNVTGMKGLEDGGESYIIYNDGHRDEYFMLENRQQTGWDSELPGSGLLIVHVDYDETIWKNNKPNDVPSHQRMTWIAADNELQYETYNGEKYLTDAGLRTDLYPSGNNNVFSNTSTPAAKLYNNNTDGTKYLNKSVEQITKNNDGTISFRFRGVSNTKAPVFSPAPGKYAEAQTVSITSETDGASIYYTIDGTDPTTESTLYLAPIVIETTTTLKAIAVKDGEESDITSGIYRIGAYSDKILVVPTGVEATTWHVVDGELTKGRTYKAGQKIPAGEAVVLFDNNPLSQVYEFEVASTCSDDCDPNNMLRGFDESSMTVGETGTNCKFYKFSFKGRDANNAPTNIGFYYGAADGAPFMSAAHKAYLAVPESALTNGAKSVFLFPQADDSEQPTGIEDVEVNGNVNTKQAIYDLQGRRMTNAQALRPGIYIVNGKKVVIK